MREGVSELIGGSPVYFLSTLERLRGSDGAGEEEVLPSLLREAISKPDGDGKLPSLQLFDLGDVDSVADCGCLPSCFSLSGGMGQR
jgi:hypothetical protein